MKKITFIGCGNMASAIIGGIIGKGYYKPEQIIASDRSEAQLEKMKTAWGIKTIVDNREAAKAGDILLLCIKPHQYEAVIKDIRDVISEDTCVVTIAPGKTLAWLEEQFGKPVKLVRTMPNTPALVSAGMTGVTPNQYMDEESTNEVLSILESFGKARLVPESLMDAVVSVSGSSPAYVFILIEAMADAAVADGMPRTLAYEFAAQAVYGSAKMVLETGRHPADLKDMVCSPGGTTIEAVRVLEKEGFRSSIFEAMKACAAKSHNM